MGFRNGLGTRETFFGVGVVFQRFLDINQDVYACFIDFEKAFDKVWHDQLRQLLIEKSIDEKDITNLYWNQTAYVKVDDEMRFVEA